MKIEERETKSFMTKSSIPNIDYVVNPYIGCQHGCVYCYAEFMKRFTNHGGDIWGEFLDIKMIDEIKIKPEKYNGKTILLSSVTDPYTSYEKKCNNTRKILEKLVGTQAKIMLLTKSSLVERDIDLFKKFENFEVGVSLNTLDQKVAHLFEPYAPSPISRLTALKKISENSIDTFVFISPIFPGLTDFKKIIEYCNFTQSFRFENLNFRPHNISRIMQIIEKHYPELIELYVKIKANPNYWVSLEEEIIEYSESRGLEYKIEFHHGGFTNKNKKK